MFNKALRQCKTKKKNGAKKMATKFSDTEILSMVLLEWGKEGIVGLPIAIEEVAAHHNINRQRIYSIVNTARLSIVIDKKTVFQSIAFSFKGQTLEA